MTLKFRNFLILSFLIHLIIVLILLLIPDKEKKVKETPPIFVDLIEPKAPPAPPKPPPPSLPKHEPPLPAKEPEQEKPVPLTKPTHEDQDAVPEELRGGLTKKPEPKKSEQQPVPKPKEAKAKMPPKPESPPAQAPAKKTAAAKKTPLPKKQKGPKKTSKAKPVPPKQDTQISKKSTSNEPKPLKRTKRKTDLQAKSDTQAQRKSILQDKPSPTGDIPASGKKPEDTVSSGGGQESSSKKGPVNIFDKDILQKHANQDLASAKSYNDSYGGPQSGKSGDHGVISLDTTDIRYVGYMSKLKQRIEYIWKYPPAAVQSGLHGDLYMRFTIMQNGSLGNVEIVRTSGHQVLDKAALQALKDGAPYWPFPTSWGKKSISITGHFIYTLGGRYGVY